MLHIFTFRLLCPFICFLISLVQMSAELKAEVGLFALWRINMTLLKRPRQLSLAEA